MIKLRFKTIYSNRVITSSLLIIFGICIGFLIATNPILDKFISTNSTPPLEKTTKVIPSSTLTPSPTETVKPTPSQVTKVVTIAPQATPSERAFKVSGAIYSVYTSSEQMELLRQKAGFPKSNENDEIIKFALWLDKNQGYLAKVEATIENYKLQQSSNSVVLPAIPNNSSSLHCSSYSVGDNTYTNCY